jgi:membrane protease YdiL (CAAX protease family)
MKIIAWFAILVSSPIFNSLVDRLFSTNADTQQWADLVKVVIISLLVVIAMVSPQLRPTRGFLIVLLAFSVGYFFVNQFEKGQLWLSFRNSSPNYQWVMADSLVQFLPTALMLAVAFAHGQTGKSLFLTKGDLSATSVIDLFGPNSSWVKLTPIFSILFLVITGSFLAFRLHMNGSDILFSKLMTALPYVILFPILNAIIEEVRFRNVLLAIGEPVLGGTTVLLMTTTLFGLSHFGSFLGASGAGGSLAAGLVYAIGAAYIGWICGRSILETRGVLAAWIIHGFSDLVIILGYILAT